MRELLEMFTDAPLGGATYIQTAGDLMKSLLVTFVLAGIMMIVYRLCHDSLTYNRKFNVTLMMLSLASTVLLALIQNNPLFSLGALGALSICRIRTNTRDPRDLGFVFWSLSIGISSALGAFVIGFVSTIIIGSVMLVLGQTNKKKDVLTMVVRGKKEQVAIVQEIFSKTSGSTVQSKNLFPDSFELVYEIKANKKEEERLLLVLNSIDGISGVNVLAPQTKVA